MKQSRRWLPLGYALVAALLAAPMGRSIQAANEEFESPDVSWRLAQSDGSAKLLLHERDFEVAHSGRGSEHARVYCTQATYVYLAHPVPPARIIDELQPSLWVKADRPGLRLMLRVVLPRAKDREGKTLTVLLEGDFYTEVGAWQRLQVRGIKKLLEAEVRIRRLQFGQFDDREAFIDHAVLNAYTGPGITELWTDDLEFEGYASSGVSTTPVHMMRTPLANAERPAESNPLGRVEQLDRAAELRGSVLLVEGRPFFMRGIEHNGEPFTWLKEVGFNTVVLRSPPNDSQLAEARDADIWLVAPPVIHNGVLEVTPAHRRVIAWRLGAGATAADATSIQNLAVQVRRQDREAARPIVCDLQRDIGHFESAGDIFMFGKPILGTSFELSDYGDWLQFESRPLGGKPFWGFVQTEPSSRLVEQLGIAFAKSNGSTAQGMRVPKLSATSEQMRLLAFETIAAGARGICFRSRSRLDLDDDVATLRAASLRMINSQLSLVAPWAAGGSVAEEVPIRGASARGRVLETERARLLLITRHAVGQQFVPHAVEKQSLSFAIHSIPITDQAYHLRANGLQPLIRTQTSGPRVTIDDTSSVSLVLFSQDPLVINRSTRTLAKNREQQASLQHEIVRRELDQTSAVASQIGSDDASDELDQARTMLDRAEELLRTGDLKNAFSTTRMAQTTIHRIRRELWEEAVLAFPSPTSSHLCSSFMTLPLHHQASNLLAGATWRNNILKAGNCESLEQMLSAGWRQHVVDDRANETLVELSVQDPAGGRLALRLVSRAPSSPQKDARSAPLKITSAPVPVHAGQCVRIHGWVKVSSVSSEDDGLRIFDSLSGDEFAEHIDATKGWREFTHYRIAPRSGEFVVTFALSGRGEAWVDEVSVTALQ